MAAETFGSHLPRLQLSEHEVHAALAAAGLARGERYLEPGCGEGVGLVVAARDFGARAHGVELHGPSIELALERAAQAKVDIVVAAGDLQDHPLGDADVVLLYLGPAFHDLLADRLARELAPGARVVSWGWQVPGWAADAASDELGQAWVYRPADAARQLSWEPVPALRTLPAGATLEALTVTAHADLPDLTVTATGDGAAWLSDARVAPAVLRRGQSAWVELGWLASAAGSVEAQLQLHSAGTAVGPPLELAAATAMAPPPIPR